MKNNAWKKGLVLGIIILFVGAGVTPSISGDIRKIGECIEKISGWSLETVDSTGNIGMFTSIALDSNQYPHISYWDNSNDDLKYAKWTGSSWSKETVDSTGGNGKYTSIALDSNQYPHISYYDDSNDDLKYAKWTGSSWSKETVDSVGDVGHFTSIALDSNDYPHISYYYPTNDDLKYAKWTGSSWSKETVDSVGVVGEYTSIALDSNDQPHISYYDGSNSDLKYAKWTGSSWSKETVDSVGNVPGGQYYALLDSLTLDSNDQPHIAYHDWINRDLRYAKWTGSSWYKETVDSSGLAGMYPSIALDSNDQPHISHYEGDYNDLKYAKWTGSSWSKETVDSNGAVGHFTSIALDIYNKPHISYEDETNHDLKYATIENQLPTVEITFPEENNRIAGTIIVQGTSNDIDGTVVLVEVKIDNSDWEPAASTTSWSYWSYEWDTTEVDDDAHIIYARSYDGEAYSTIESINVNVYNARIMGIDVSHYQNDKGEINWTKVNNSGNIFSFVKATGGTGFVDDYFDDNMQNGSDVGMLMGIYHFAWPHLYDAEAEAKHFNGTASEYLQPGYLRPALDLEKGGELGKEKLTNWVHTWMKYVENETGIQPLLYTRPSFAEENLTDSIGIYDLWLAHWTYDPESPPDIPSQWKDWDFWQYSDTGSTAGIVGDVDLDVFNGDMDRLKTFLIVDLDISISGLFGIFGIKTTILNKGDGDDTYDEITDGDAVDVNWSIKFEGGIILWPPGGFKEGLIEEIRVGDSASILTFVLGFGKVDITVKVWCRSGSATAITSARVFGPFVFGIK